ncbi:hypothetical protein LguiA_001746 [Lonicera macranthoides]
MEMLLSLTIASIFLLSLYYVLWGLKIAKKNKAPPKAGGAWPIIGHLHLLGGPQVPHKTLASMADKHGPIFTFKLGIHQVLVVSDSNLAKECLTTNDKAFANRPKSVAVELMGYNYAMFGLGPYGPYWRQVRKTVVNDLLSKHQISALEHFRVSEVRETMQETYKSCLSNKSGSNKAKAEMKDWFGRIVLNTVVRMITGKRYSSEDERGLKDSLKVLRDFLVLLGIFVVADAIPWLRWLDFGGHEKAMKETFMEIDCILQGWLEEHKRKRTIDNEEKDFMDVMLSTLEGVSHQELGGFDVDIVAKSTCLSMLAGAVDTTLVMLTWALSLLLNNKNTLKMVQEELDLHVGKERQVEESDIKNLVYLQAVFKETLRLYPAGPLSAPHESIEDCVVGGYHIPKGTRLLINVWKIHRDPSIWSDPSEFHPERFLTSHKEVDFRGQHFELIPFGSGRRICPGISLAMQDMQLILASLIHGFEVAKVSDEPIDMSESFGLTNLKNTPLEVFLKPRLSPNLYE